ncbi:MAG: hypothetical protein Q8P95_03910 [bacterium]|nr:hypothetical protein [bacterium]
MRLLTPDHDKELSSAELNFLASFENIIRTEFPWTPWLLYRLNAGKKHCLQTRKDILACLLRLSPHEFTAITAKTLDLPITFTLRQQSQPDSGDYSALAHLRDLSEKPKGDDPGERRAHAKISEYAREKAEIRERLRIRHSKIRDALYHGTDALIQDHLDGGEAPFTDQELSHLFGLSTAVIARFIEGVRSAIDFLSHAEKSFPELNRGEKKQYRTIVAPLGHYRREEGFLVALAYKDLLISKEAAAYYFGVKIEAIGQAVKRALTHVGRSDESKRKRIRDNEVINPSEVRAIREYKTRKLGGYGLTKALGTKDFRAAEKKMARIIANQPDSFSDCPRVRPKSCSLDPEEKIKAARRYYAGSRDDEELREELMDLFSCPTIGSLRTTVYRVRRENSGRFNDLPNTQLKKGAKQRFIPAVREYLTDSATQLGHIMARLECRTAKTAHARVRLVLAAYPESFKNLERVRFMES